jgi:hypothetical protein
MSLAPDRKQQLEEALVKLMNTIESLNRTKSELEREKQLIRDALTNGTAHQLERARLLQQKWDEGIQMIPLYPEDFRPRVAADPYPGTVALYPFNSAQYRFEGEPVVRDWIHVAPPSLGPDPAVVYVREKASSKRSSLPARVIADWRLLKSPHSVGARVWEDNAAPCGTLQSVVREGIRATNSGNIAFAVDHAVPGVANQTQRIYIANQVPSVTAYV